MAAQMEQELEYGHWVPVKMMIAPSVIGIALAAFGLVHWGFLIAGGVFLLIAVYMGAARYMFSAQGQNIEDRVRQLVVDHTDWQGKGKALDIGCGNGPLVIKLAQRFPEAEVTGLDFWGKDWDYSMQVCEENTRLAGVAKQVSFRQGSASALPFEDASFDLVVSNLTFHEVEDAKDKRDCIKEALRVLKPGGVFVLQDLFLLRPYYGTPEELVETVQGWGGRDVEFIRTCDESFIPMMVKLPFMIGTLAILRGRK
jgi:SAM-dependent methyltransferase